MTDRVRVALVRTSPATVLADYRRVLELSGCTDILAGAERITAYGNLTWSRFYPPASSPPWQLDGVAAVIAGNGTIRWVTGTGHTSRPRQGARAYCWPAALARHHQVFRPVGRSDFLPYPEEVRTFVLDRIVPGGLPVPPAFRGTVALHMPTLKTHGQLSLAGAMENAWATWLPAGGGLAAAHPHEVIVDLLLLQRVIHRAVCAVMDGAIAGAGAGPRTVEPLEANVLLASADPVALDAVAARLAGLNPFSIRCLALAHAAGLGCADTDDIELVGDEVPRGQLQLRVRRPPPALARAALEQVRLLRVERALFRHRRWLAAASTVYYDLIWYHLVGRPRLRAFQRTGWGQLFNTYAS